ncbi:MAG: succinate dehydrogenase, cytochrome b556 subunit [Rickettsiaceae bacterium]|nr:succinate dehydrogenase, cytochrome b556 subunit [Rickettsiaceae bacterium]
MNHQRFVNLNLLKIQYPLTAIISILHRLSGLLLFLLIPYLLWLLDVALSSASGFNYIQSVLMNPINKCVIWFFLSAFGYHLLAGIRHLLMDVGFAESLKSARLSGIIILTITVIWIISVGKWLW